MDITYPNRIDGKEPPRTMPVYIVLVHNKLTGFAGVHSVHMSMSAALDVSRHLPKSTVEESKMPAMVYVARGLSPIDDENNHPHQETLGVSFFSGMADDAAEAQRLVTCEARGWGLTDKITNSQFYSFEMRLDDFLVVLPCTEDES